MPYFDPTSTADLQLLHPASVREHSELDSVAAAAERDVLSRSRREAEGEPEDVAEALRLTIADVTAHRLQHYGEDDTLSAESRGSRSMARAQGALDADWPKGWDCRLRRFASSTHAA